MSRIKGRREFKSRYKRKFRMPKALTSMILAGIVLITGYMGFKGRKSNQTLPAEENSGIEALSSSIEIPKISYDEDINIEDITIPSRIDASKIVVLDTNNDYIYNKTNTAKKHYYLYRTEISTIIDEEVVCYYFDIMDEHGVASISFDKTYLAYNNSTDNVSAISITEDNTVQNINAFLTGENLESYSKAEYSKKDLEQLDGILNNLNSYIPASDILVLDTSSTSVIYSTNTVNYYFLRKDANINSIYNEFNYRDIFNNFAYACISENKRIGEYADVENNSRISYWAIEGENPAGIPLIEFLKNRGLNDLIKEKYTEEELKEIYDYVCEMEITNARTS